MASEADIPESMVTQTHEETIGSTNEDKEGKKHLEAVKGNNENTDGECFLNPPSVGKIASEHMDKLPEDCPEPGPSPSDESEIIIPQKCIERTVPPDTNVLQEKIEATNSDDSVVQCTQVGVPKERAESENLKKDGDEETLDNGVDDTVVSQTTTSFVESDKEDDESGIAINLPESIKSIEEVICLQQVGKDINLEDGSNYSFENNCQDTIGSNKKLENKLRVEEKNVVSDMVNQVEDMGTDKVHNDEEETNLLSKTDSEVTVKDVLINYTQNERPAEKNVKESSNKLVANNEENMNPVALQGLALEPASEAKEKTERNSLEETVKVDSENQEQRNDKLEAENFDTAGTTQDNTSEADVKETTGLEDSNVSQIENDSSLGYEVVDDPSEEEDENQDERYKFEPQEQEKQDTEVSKIVEFVGSEGNNLDEEPTSKDLNPKTTTEERKVAEFLGSKPENRKEDGDVSRNLSTKKGQNESTLSENDHTHEIMMPDSVAREVVENFQDEKTEVSNLKQSTNQKNAEDNHFTGVMSESKIKEMEEKLSEEIKDPETVAALQGTALEANNVGEIIDSSVDKCEGSLEGDNQILSPGEYPKENPKEITCAQVAEEIHEPEESIQVKSTKLDDPEIEQALLTTDREAQALNLRNSEMRTYIHKEEANNNSSEISENIIEDRAEKVEAEMYQTKDNEDSRELASRGDSAFGAHSTEPAKEETTKISCPVDIVIIEVEGNNIEYSASPTDSGEEERILEKKVYHIVENPAQSDSTTESAMHEAIAEIDTIKSDHESTTSRPPPEENYGMENYLTNKETGCSYEEDKISREGASNSSVHETCTSQALETSSKSSHSVEDDVKGSSTEKCSNVEDDITIDKQTEDEKPDIRQETKNKSEDLLEETPAKELDIFNAEGMINIDEYPSTDNNGEHFRLQLEGNVSESNKIEDQVCELSVPNVDVEDALQRRDDSTNTSNDRIKIFEKKEQEGACVGETYNQENEGANKTRDIASTAENLEPVDALEKLESCLEPSSTCQNHTSSAEANLLVNEDQGPSITGLEIEVDAAVTSEDGDKAANEFELNEETQRNKKEAIGYVHHVMEETVDDEEKIKKMNADPAQQQDETNTTKSDDIEVLIDGKYHEGSRSNEIRVTNIVEDVQEEAAFDKQLKNIEDEGPKNIADGVSETENSKSADAVEELENSEADNSMISAETDEFACEENNKVMENQDAKCVEHHHQEGYDEMIGLRVTGMKFELKDEDSVNKSLSMAQEANAIEINEEDFEQQIMGERIHEEAEEVMNQGFEVSKSGDAMQNQETDQASTPTTDGKNPITCQHECTGISNEGIQDVEEATICKQIDNPENEGQNNITYGVSAEEIKDPETVASLEGTELEANNVGEIVDSSIDKCKGSLEGDNQILSPEEYPEENPKEITCAQAAEEIHDPVESLPMKSTKHDAREIEQTPLTTDGEHQALNLTISEMKTYVHKEETNHNSRQILENISEERAEKVEAEMYQAKDIEDSQELTFKGDSAFGAHSTEPAKEETTKMSCPVDIVMTEEERNNIEYSASPTESEEDERILETKVYHIVENSAESDSTTESGEHEAIAERDTIQNDHDNTTSTTQEENYLNDKNNGEDTISRDEVSHSIVYETCISQALETSSELSHPVEDDVKGSSIEECCNVDDDVTIDKQTEDEKPDIRKETGNIFEDLLEETPAIEHDIFTAEECIDIDENPPIGNSGEHNKLQLEGNVSESNKIEDQVCELSVPNVDVEDALQRRDDSANTSNDGIHILEKKEVEEACVGENYIQENEGANNTSDVASTAENLEAVDVLEKLESCLEPSSTCENRTSFAEANLQVNEDQDAKSTMNILLEYHDNDQGMSITGLEIEVDAPVIAEDIDKEEIEKMNADPAEQHDETNTTRSYNIEVPIDGEEHQRSRSNEIHRTNIVEDIQENAAFDKHLNNIQDESPNKIADGVSTIENSESADAVEELENYEGDNSKISAEANEFASEGNNKVMEYQDAKCDEHHHQEGYNEMIGSRVTGLEFELKDDDSVNEATNAIEITQEDFEQQIMGERMHYEDVEIMNQSLEVRKSSDGMQNQETDQASTPTTDGENTVTCQHECTGISNGVQVIEEATIFSMATTTDGNDPDANDTVNPIENGYGDTKILSTKSEGFNLAESCIEKEEDANKEVKSIDANGDSPQLENERNTCISGNMQVQEVEKTDEVYKSIDMEESSLVIDKEIVNPGFIGNEMGILSQDESHDDKTQVIQVNTAKGINAECDTHQHEVPLYINSISVQENLEQANLVEDFEYDSKSIDFFQNNTQREEIDIQVKYVDTSTSTNKPETVNTEANDDISWEPGPSTMAKTSREHAPLEGSLSFEAPEFGIHKEDIKEEKKHGVDCSETENKKETMNGNNNATVNAEVKHCSYEEPPKGSQSFEDVLTQKFDFSNEGNGKEEKWAIDCDEIAKNIVEGNGDLSEETAEECAPLEVSQSSTDVLVHKFDTPKEGIKEEENKEEDFGETANTTETVTAQVKNDLSEECAPLDVTQSSEDVMASEFDAPKEDIKEEEKQGVLYGEQASKMERLNVEFKDDLPKESEASVASIMMFEECASLEERQMSKFDLPKEGITEEEKQGVVCGDTPKNTERMNVEIEDVLSEAKGASVATQMSEECASPKETVSAEVKNDLADETGSLIVAQKSEEYEPLEERQPFADALVLKFDIQKEDINEEEIQVVDSSENKLNIKSTTMKEETTSQEVRLEGKAIKDVDVSSTEDNLTTKNIEMIRFPELHLSRDVASTVINANQSVDEKEFDACQDVNTMTAAGIVQNQISQREELEHKQEATSTNTDLEESAMRIQDLRKEKPDDSISVRDTEESYIADKTQRQLELPNSDVEPSMELPLKQEPVEIDMIACKSSMAEPGDLSSTLGGVNLPLESETKNSENCTDNFSQEVINETEHQFSNKLQKPNKASLQMDSTSDNQEQVTKFEEAEGEKKYNVERSELITEENQSQKNFEMLESTTCNATREENLVPVDPLEKIEGNLEVLVSSEKRIELDDVNMTVNEETSAEVEGYATKSAENRIEKDYIEEHTLTIKGSDIKLDECSLERTEVSNQVAKELMLKDESSTTTREATKEDFQQATAGARTDYEDYSMHPKSDVSELPSERNGSEADKVNVQKDEIANEVTGSNKRDGLDLEKAEEVASQGDSGQISNDTVKVDEVEERETNQEEHRLINVSAEKVKSVDKPGSESRAVTIYGELNGSDASEAPKEWAPMEESRKPENVKAKGEIPTENIKEEQQLVACYHNMLNIDNMTLAKEETSSQETHPQGNTAKGALDICLTVENGEMMTAADIIENHGEQFPPMVEEHENQGAKVAKEHEPGYVASRKIDANQSTEILTEVDDGGVLFSNVTSPMNNQDIEEITAADIIASQICLEIEREEKLRRLSSEQHKDKYEATIVIGNNTLDNRVLNNTNDTCLEETPKQTECCEHVPELHGGRITKSEETDPQKHHKTENNELLVEPKSALTFEAHEDIISDSAKQEVANNKHVWGVSQGSSGDETKVQNHHENKQTSGASPDNDDRQMLVARENEIPYVKVMCHDPKVGLQTTKSPDKAEKAVKVDEHRTGAQLDASSVGHTKEEASRKGCCGILDVIPKAQEQASEESRVRVKDEKDKSTLVAKEEGELQENYNNLQLLSQIQDSCSHDHLKETIEEPAHNKGDSILERMQLGEDISKGIAEEQNETKIQTTPIIDSTRITSSDIMQRSSEETCQTAPSNMLEGGEEIILKKETLIRSEDEEKEEEGNDENHMDSDLKAPFITESMREMDLKATHKKAHNILSGVGSKVKHSISKVKKAIACSSSQFSSEDVIVKLNKSKKI